MINFVLYLFCSNKDMTSAIDVTEQVTGPEIVPMIVTMVSVGQGGVEVEEVDTDPHHQGVEEGMNAQILVSADGLHIILYSTV